MTTSPTSLRQRGGQTVKKEKSAPAPLVTGEKDTDGFLNTTKASGPGSEWDYKLALFVITALAFTTRFWGIGHPNEVVFDEVHFGKVSNILRPRRVQYLVHSFPFT